MKKWSIRLILILVLLLLAAGCGGGQARSFTAEDILREEAIQRGDLDITVPASGNVAANDTVALSFEIPGVVAEVTVAMSDAVTKGEVLARLKTADMEHALRRAEIALEQAELSLAMLLEPPSEDALALARWTVQQAAQSLEVARANQEAALAQGGFSIRQAQDFLERAEEAYQSAQDMIEQFNLPEVHGAGAYVAYVEAEGNVGITQVRAELQIQQANSQWLIAYNSYRQAVEDLESLESPAEENQVRQTELQIEQARLNLQQARDSLEQAVLTAPFDGVVAAVNVNPGAPASTGMPAITLIDASSFYVQVTVDEIDIGSVNVGQSVQVKLDAYPDQALDGVVESITTLPSPVMGIIAYPLRVRLTDTRDVDVRDGMTANVVIQTRVVEDVLLVPNWAIRTDAAGFYVYVRVGDGVERADITTGERSDAFTEVLSGLEVGDVVALVTEERGSLLEMRGPPSRGQ